MQELTGRLLVEEERSGNGVSSSGQRNSALVVGVQHSVKCFECGKVGHKKNKCRNRKCYKCQKIAHVIKYCRLIKNKNSNSKTSFVREIQSNLLNFKNFVLD